MFMIEPGHWLGIVFSIVGKFGNAGGFVLVYQQGCEMFPTVLRSTGLGLMTLVGMSFSAFLPQIIYWVRISMHII
jgi:hypothetical protein